MRQNKQDVDFIKKWGLTKLPRHWFRPRRCQKHIDLRLGWTHPSADCLHRCCLSWAELRLPVLLGPLFLIRTICLYISASIQLNERHRDPQRSRSKTRESLQNIKTPSPGIVTSIGLYQNQNIIPLADKNKNLGQHHISYLLQLPL